MHRIKAWFHGIRAYLVIGACFGTLSLLAATGSNYHFQVRQQAIEALAGGLGELAEHARDTLQGNQAQTAEIDQQHLDLFDQINHLFHTLNQGMASESSAVAGAVDRLYDYLKDHFRYEEEWLYHPEAKPDFQVSSKIATSSNIELF